MQNTVRFVGQAGPPVDLLLLLKSVWLLEVSHSTQRGRWELTNRRHLHQPITAQTAARLTKASWPRQSRQSRSQGRLWTYNKLLGEHRTRSGTSPTHLWGPQMGCWQGEEGTRPEPRPDSWMCIFFFYLHFSHYKIVSVEGAHICQGPSHGRRRLQIDGRGWGWGGNTKGEWRWNMQMFELQLSKFVYHRCRFACVDSVQSKQP